MTTGMRRALVASTLFVAGTAVAGGSALIIGTVIDDRSGILTPDSSFLEGTALDSYLLPGLLLATVIGGTHAIAGAALVRRDPRALLATTVAGFGILIWVFVQMAVVPFSALQALYFAIGLAEVGLTLVALGLFGRRMVPVAVQPSRRA